MSSFADATPHWAPPDYADVRAAWTGPHPVLKDVTLRIEGAAYRGKPVFFDVIGPWTDPERMQPDRESLRRSGVRRPGLHHPRRADGIGRACWRRRHIRTNRADRRGAWRVTAYLAMAGMLAWLLRASHSSSAGRRSRRSPSGPPPTSRCSG